MARRIERVENNIQRIVAEIIDRELQPPGMVSVMSVTCDNGLTTARIAVSVYSKTPDAISTIEYLQQRSAFIQRELSTRADMRRTPKIEFILDTSLEDGQSMIEYISGLSDRR